MKYNQIELDILILLNMTKFAIYDFASLTIKQLFLHTLALKFTEKFRQNCCRVQDLDIHAMIKYTHIKDLVRLTNAHLKKLEEIRVL